jgi:hypothetical protein
MKNCIAVLTRGYKTLHEYEYLIKRNQHVSNNLEDKSTDILIFHEGNIEPEHQQGIQKETPDIRLQFIDISSGAFRKECENIPVESGHGFAIGYRHMCSFWFVDFWKFVEGYDNLLRIDEDCYVDFNLDRVFLNLNKCYFITGDTCQDCDFVTVGLNQFSLDFVDKNKHEFIFKSFSPNWPQGPYTNMFAISLNVIKDNEIFKKYVDAIDESKMIYRRRWGDLPLWGDAILYIFGMETLKIDKTLKYYHGSHYIQINA